MKKFLLTLVAVVLVSIPTYAYDAKSKVQTIGTQLLTKSGISATNVTFTVTETVDNSNFATDRIINISQDELSFAGNDNEVAAIVATEIGQIICGNASKAKVISLLQENTTKSTNAVKTFSENYKTTKKDKNADLVAVNLMMSASYNPLALIVVLTKQTGTYWDAIIGRPANADKALNVYDYISYVYPEKLKAGYGCNEYKTFVAYAQSIVSERNSNQKLKNLYVKNYAKEQKRVIKNITSFKTRGGLSIWDATFGFLSA